MEGEKTIIDDDHHHPHQAHKPTWWGSLTSSRTLSILSAIGVDVGLVWLLLFRQGWDLPVGTAEFFWVRSFVAFVGYVTIQQWTLAVTTGRETDFMASFDKIIALSPLVVWGLCEIYWIGGGSVFSLSWRHHLVGAAYGIYAIADYFSTDVVNQRLRARQIGIGTGGVG